MHNQHAGLSQLLATQRITERHEQAIQNRLTHSAGRPPSTPRPLIDPEATNPSAPAPPIGTGSTTSWTNGRPSPSNPADHRPERKEQQ